MNNGLEEFAFVLVVQSYLDNLERTNRFSEKEDLKIRKLIKDMSEVKKFKITNLEPIFQRLEQLKRKLS